MIKIQQQPLPQIDSGYLMSGLRRMEPHSEQVKATPNHTFQLILILVGKE